MHAASAGLALRRALALRVRGVGSVMPTLTCLALPRVRLRHGVVRDRGVMTCSSSHDSCGVLRVGLVLFYTFVSYYRTCNLFRFSRKRIYRISASPAAVTALETPVSTL